jgi:hypothetical protein
MNFNPRQPAGKLRDGSGNKWHFVGLQPVGYSVGQQGMETCIRQNNFNPAGCGGVAVEDRLEILSYRSQHR